MNKKMRIVISTVLTGIMVMFILGQATAFAQSGTTRIIRIWRLLTEGEKAVIVEPETTYVSEEAVVVWWNKGREEVKVRFLDGRKCEVQSSSPTGFVMESEDCYQTSYMASGTISSLKFDEEGTYEFEVETTDAGVAKGKIVVSKKE